jgi:NAD(P)-dependent dehydrogenase (short-subunit alcohol dehydrogenase family)
MLRGSGLLSSTLITRIAGFPGWTKSMMSQVDGPNDQDVAVPWINSCTPGTIKLMPIPSSRQAYWPEEIAELMAFLVSPSMKRMTGSAVRMDRGENDFGINDSLTISQ